MYDCDEDLTREAEGAYRGRWDRLLDAVRSDERRIACQQKTVLGIVLVAAILCLALAALLRGAPAPLPRTPRADAEHPRRALGAWSLYCDGADRSRPFHGSFEVELLGGGRTDRGGRLLVFDETGDRRVRLRPGARLSELSREGEVITYARRAEE